MNVFAAAIRDIQQAGYRPEQVEGQMGHKFGWVTGHSMTHEGHDPLLFN